MNGWRGKVLHVDLTRGVIREESLDPKVAKDYIGGRGLGIYYLRQEVNPKCDPLSPENLLVMATGPLTGTRASSGGRYMVMAKSPLTGAITCSNAGGLFPTELKRAGLDAITFSGRATEPVYLWIVDGKAELRPAKHLWGKTTTETTDHLLNETDPEAKVACIGPAGENLVLFASVMNDSGRAAGRSGVGAVMGSKNLKAVVVRGRGKIPLADEARFKEFHSHIVNTFNESTRDNPPVLRTYGTTYGVGTMNSLGSLPTKNFQQSTFEQWQDGVAEEFHEKYFVRNKACYACLIGCTRISEVKEPGYEGKGKGPEYETLYAMGSNCMIHDLPAVIKANYICNEMGMDTMTMGATVACAMELFDRGYLPEEEIGRPLAWGDGHALVELTRITALREGFGDVLAGGSYRVADRYGHPELAMVAKKQEFAGYEPRNGQGMGLAYATSPIGGSHMRGDPAYFEIFGVPLKIDALEWRGKAQLVKIWQDLSCILDSAGLCIFFTMRYLVEPELEARPAGILEYLNAATGANYTLDELLKAGERIFNAERLFLVEAGLSSEDDTLPPRLTQEPLPDGPAKGHVCHLEEMLKDYYPSRGWTQDGVPTQETLKALDLA
jgi:aldehyde:ferredoxin oxidoreductase